VILLSVFAEGSCLLQVDHFNKFQIHCKDLTIERCQYKGRCSRVKETLGH